MALNFIRVKTREEDYLITNNRSTKMEILKSLLKSAFNRRLLGIFAVFSILFIVGCQESVTNPEESEPTSDQEALQKIADEDSSLESFDDAYNEEDLMDFGLGKIQTPVYPFRVGHRVHLVNRTLTVDIQGDTAYGTITKNFEGVLLIEASYDSGSTAPDTVIQKVFSATVTRNIIFVKVGHSDRPLLNWKIAAISLPEGGALSSNIEIKKLTVFLPGSDEIVVESPNDYYLSRQRGWMHWKDIPVIPRFDSVLVRVELFSSYEDDDFVTVTFGRNRFVGNRIKRRFELVSSTQVSGGYIRVYEQTFRAYSFPGFFHAIINAFPKQVIFDDAAPVESSMWGIPYYVKPL